jgi:amphi-Trp domain-containing protein
MKHARNELKVDGAVELPRVVEYLEQLVQALKTGTVVVRQGEEQLQLGPRGVVGFALSAREKGKRQELSLALRWRKFSAPDDDLDLKIGPPPAPPSVAEAIGTYAAAAAEERAAETKADGEPAETLGDAYTQHPRGG